MVSVDPVTTVQFSGTSEGDVGGGAEPPDEWVAAGPSSIMESTNGVISVYSRSGQLSGSAASWAFFGVPAGFQDSDPRILYDAAHARWVASEVAFVDLTPGFIGLIFLAVSAGTDPLGAWTVYAFSYGADLPDYPGLASSSDKIVVTANEYDETGYVGGSILAMGWSTILAGGFGAYLTDPDPGLFAIRPGRISGTSTATLHFVAEGAAGEVMYERMTGGAATVTTAGFVDLTAGGPLLAAFLNPVAPRQPGGDTIEDAVDERPTDAVAYGNQLYFVSTYPDDPGAGVVDTVRVTRLVTDTTIPTAGSDLLIETDGVDQYMGGIGVSGNGTPFVTYTSSSTTADPSAHYRTLVADSVGTDKALGASDSPYGGERWGDYVGVSADPGGTGAVWLVGEVAAADTSWRTIVARAVLDSTNPTAPGLPLPALVAGTTVTDDFVPVRISWTAGSDATSGVKGYDVAVSEGGNPFDTPRLSTALSIVRPALWEDSYQYNVATVDAVGNSSSTAIGPAFTVWDYWTPALTTTGSWHTSSSSSFFNGSARYASTAGASATFSFTGRGVGLLSYKSTSRGSMRIYVDGVYRTALSLYSTTSKAHQLVYQFGWSSVGSHKIKLVVVGTSGHPRVDIDGFAVLRNPAP